MDWSDYIERVVQGDAKNFSEMVITFPDISYPGPLFFVKLNADLLRSFAQKSNEQYVFVYPHTKHFVLSLLVYKVVRDVLSGDVPAVFKVEDLKLGDKVYVGKAVAEIVDDCIINGTPYFFFGVKGEKYGFPKSVLGPLPLANPSSKLSSKKLFDSEWIRYKKTNELCANASDFDVEEFNSQIANKLSSKKSFAETGIILVTNTRYAQSVLEKATINEKPLLECISVTLINTNGKEIPLSGNFKNPELIVAANPEVASEYL